MKKSLTEIRWILHSSLNDESFHHIYHQRKKAFPFAREKNADYHHLYFELLEMAGWAVVDQLKRGLEREELFYISDQVDIFLKARGFKTF